MICFFVFLFFWFPFSVLCWKNDIRIKGSHSKKKEAKRQTDRQTEGQTETDRHRQTETDNQRERERHEHSHSVMHTQVSGFKISAVSVFRNSAWLPLSGGSQVGRALFLDGLSHRSLHWFRHQNK